MGRALRACETRLEDSSELQWRQVHPTAMDGDEVGLVAFRGSPADREAVSCSRSALQSAETAYRHHVETLKLESCGSWSVTVGEASAAACDVVDDSACDDVATPAHSFISMHGLTKLEQKAARVLLAACANRRGVQFPPPERSS